MSGCWTRILWTKSIFIILVKIGFFLCKTIGSMIGIDPIERSKPCKSEFFFLWLNLQIY
jgi:hypothetical protein